MTAEDVVPGSIWRVDGEELMVICPADDWWILCFRMHDMVSLPVHLRRFVGGRLSGPARKVFDPTT